MPNFAAVERASRTNPSRSESLGVARAHGDPGPVGRPQVAGEVLPPFRFQRVGEVVVEPCVAVQGQSPSDIDVDAAESGRGQQAAEAQHDRATSPAGPFTGYPRAGLDFQRGRVHLALGNTTEAVRALTSSADDRAADRHRSSALTRARLAETLLSVGHLDESCVHWNLFLDHYPSLRSAPADQAHRRLLTSLRGFRRQPQAAAVIHRARTFPRRRPAH